MDLDRDAVPAFRVAFNEVARARLTAEHLRPTLRPDLVLPVDEIDLELVHWMSYLGPHGIGNPGPLFLGRDVALSGAREVGEGHLKVSLVTDRARVEAIGFGLAERHPPGSLGGGPYDAVFRLERNEWRGVAKAQARLVDLRPAGPTADETG